MKGSITTVGMQSVRYCDARPVGADANARRNRDGEDIANSCRARRVRSPTPQTPVGTRAAGIIFRSYHVTPIARTRGVYKLWGGVAGRVVETQNISVIEAPTIKIPIGAHAA